MIEVEIKLPVPEADAVKEKLLNLGFREERWIQEHDVYFDDSRNSIRTRGEALRVRETRDCRTGQVSAQMNYKGRKLDDQTMTRQELETEVGDGAVCRAILQAAGYAPAVPEVWKERRMLRKDEITACLDHVQGLGGFLELEILVKGEEEREEALKKIEATLSRLGYRICDTVRTSYLSMLQNKS